MRGGKRPNVPAGALISLGTKAKKPLLSASSSSQSTAAKKAKNDFVEVEPSELVSRTETALSSGNIQLAESLVLSALNQLRTTGGPTSSAALAIGGPGFRSSSSGSSSGSRLLPGFSLGLLILAQAHPSLFARVVVMDQLIALLSLSPRELGISLPPAAVATICARARGLHVLAANLIYFAFASSSKWPSHLVKLYLEDSLTDRIWVDQDECRAFVLNLETAFPKVYGDPRGLFSVLCSSSGTISATSQPAGSASSSNAVHVALGLVAGSSGTTQNITADYATKDEIAEAVATTLKSASSSVAKVVHSGDPTQLVSPRFESSRQAVEVVIVNTLRDALGRRGASGAGGGGGSSGSVGTAATSGGSGASGTSGAQSVNVSTGSSAMSSAAGSTQAVGTSVGSTEVTQLRGLIRTVAMACGLPEIRGLVATRLEPWITNPKIQVYAVGLLAVLASNCRSGGLSPHDLDLMISIIYRIRYKLLKPNIQAAFFECLSHLAKANPMNLYCMIHLCAMPELKPPLTSEASDAKTSAGQFLSQTVLKVAETVRSMSTEGNEDRTGKGIAQQHSQLNTATMAAVAAGASSAAATRGSSSVYFILPFLFQRFGAQWIRIMGNLLHERLLLAASASDFGPLGNASTLTSSQVVDEVNTALAPVYAFLRELARSSRPNLTDSGPHGANQGSSGTVPATALSGNQPQLAQQVYLPCAELAGALLQDRIYRLNTTATAAANTIISALSSSSDEHRTSPDQSVSVGRVQFYLNGLVALVCALQMLSASRPHLVGTSASRRTNAHGDAMKSHQTALRQIRLAVVRWAKTILPPLVNAAIQSTGSLSPHNSTLLTCMDALKPSLLIRRAFMLDSTAPLHRTESISYQLQPFYPVKEIWANDQEYNVLIRLVTDTVLPEKLAHQLLILGLEPSRQLFNPLDALDMVCELIGRAALLARDSGLEPLNVSKPEQLIDLLYACCTYVPEQQLPSDITELAYASAYWRVSITAVILAAHCLQTCGSHLWSHYPTIRRLMEMTMTNNFTGTTDISDVDNSIVEAERLNAQIELQLILRLESFLLNATTDDAGNPVAIVTPETSKLIGRLVRNNPRGPCRLPPADKLQTLRLLADELALGRRLWRCREPDFLLEFLRSQAGHANVQPWLVRLVESSGSDFELLPVQCLCEYLLRDAMGRTHQSHLYVVPLCGAEPNARLHLTGSRCTNDWRFVPKDVKNDPHTSKSQLRAHLVAKLRDSLRTFGNSTTSDGLIHSFFARLNNQHSWIRQAVRQCLFILTEPETSTTVRSQESVLDWLSVLHTLRQLPALRSEPKAGSSVPPGAGTTEPMQHLLSAVLDSLLVETELDILTASLVFLSHVTRSSDFVSWRPVVTSLTRFILSRPNVLSALLHSPTRPHSVSEQTEPVLDTAYLALEALAEMHVRYVEYNCTAAGAIPVDEHKSVFVTWSEDRECPLELEFIQAQLLLLTHIHDGLPHQPPASVLEVLDAFHEVDPEPIEHSWWVRLRDTWFVAATDEQFCLPRLTPFATQPTHFPGADVFHQYQLTFDQPTSADQIPRPCLSSALRCGLICSNQAPLVSGALWQIHVQELIDVMKNSPAYLLSVETAQRLLSCWDTLKQQLPAEEQQDLGLAVSQLHSRCDGGVSKKEVTQSNAVESRLQSDIDNSPPVVMDVSASNLQVQVSGEAESSVWSCLVNTLSSLSSCEQTRIICKTMRELASDETKHRLWLEQLVQELTSFAHLVDSKRSPLGSPKTGHSRTRPSRDAQLSAFQRMACSDPALCRTIRPLVLTCLSVTSPSSGKLNRLLSTFDKRSAHSPEARCILNNLFPPRDHFPRSLPTDTSPAPLGSPESRSMEVDDKTAHDNSNATFVDQVGHFGLVELIHRLPPSLNNFNDDAVSPDDSETDQARLLRAIQFTVFRHVGFGASSSSDHCGSTAIASDLDGAYLLRCLLQQANPSILCHLLRSLLQTAHVETVDSTQLLDFFMAVLTLPRLTYPVPRSEPRDRPDHTAALSELHQLTVIEAIHLLLHILSEARQTALQSTTKTGIVRLIDATLVRRTALLNLIVIQHPGSCVHYLELLSGCLESDNSKLIPTELTTDHLRAYSGCAMWNLVALRFLIHIYQQWPGVIGLIKSNAAKAWVAYPYRFRSLVRTHPQLRAISEQSDLPLSSVGHIPQPEIDRLGPLLLVSLTSSNTILIESAQLACRSLVVHHPRAALRLLPVLAALSDGRLGLSWTQFSNRRYHMLFGDLLHLLELLATFKVDDQGEQQDRPIVDLEFEMNRNDSALFSEEATIHRTGIERLLTNMIRMLARYRQQAKRLGGFTARLAHLLESYGSHESGRQSLLTVCKAVPEELDQLITDFDEFSSLLVSVMSSSERPNSDAVTTGASVEFPFQSPSSAVQGTRLSRRWTVAVQPFRQRLQLADNVHAILELLEDLNETSKRRVDILLHFKVDLERLIGHSTESVCALSLQLLLRLLHQYPRMAPSVIETTVLPCLSPKLSDHGSMPLPVLESLPSLCLLAPMLAPKLLHACAENVLFGVPSASSYALVSAVEEAVRRLTLDGLDAACVEHASSALVSRSNLIRGAPST